MTLLRTKKGIYLDYAATTPVSESVMKEMEPYFSKDFGNPSSLHVVGQKAQAAVDTARHDVSDILGSSWKEVIFTASATESINLALRGLIKTARGVPGTPPHIITTNIEHSAVLKTCQDLEKEDVEVTYVPVDSGGLVGAGQIEAALKENTVLVSVMYVNNEIGTIQPIAEIAEAISRAKSKSQIANSKSPKSKPLAISHLPFAACHLPYFHADAVQAANYLDINVQDLGVDLMTLSGHKIYAPKGVGVLYKKENVPLAPEITGGEQERGFRAGTENVPALVGFAAALKDVEEQKEKESKRVEELRDYFIERVLAGAHGVSLNGSRTHRVANNANFCFENMTSEALIPALDAEGIHASSGSACTARVPEPSHVIRALGKEKCAQHSIRFSLGRPTTKRDVERVIEILVKLSKSSK